MMTNPFVFLGLVLLLFVVVVVIKLNSRDKGDVEIKRIAIAIECLGVL